MRGSPVLQAIVVLLVFVALGAAGAGLLENRSAEAGKTHTSASAGASPVLVDVEIYFSEKPLRYTLRRPGDGWHSDERILSAEGSAENPALHEFTLRGADDSVVWLDVTWPEARREGRYFAQVVLAAGGAEPKVFTFHSQGRQLRGTMEISPREDSGHE